MVELRTQPVEDGYNPNPGEGHGYNPNPGEGHVYNPVVVKVMVKVI